MKNGNKLKAEICQMIMNYTAEELYELVTGDNPFRIKVCENCIEHFGECPETMDGDDLCVERFEQWYNMEA